jgi:hypothetical protein
MKEDPIRPDSDARSHLVDRDLAARAVEMALPLLHEAMRHEEYGDSGFLHIVIMDPALRPRDCDFEAAILHEHSIGDESRWDADYRGFARAKAALAWRHGRDSHEVQTRRAHCLRPGDSTLWGSVCVDGIVVGASGAFPMFDEAYSGVIAMCLRGLAKDRPERERVGKVVWGR